MAVTTTTMKTTAKTRELLSYVLYYRAMLKRFVVYFSPCLFFYWFRIFFYTLYCSRGLMFCSPILYFTSHFTRFSYLIVSKFRLFDIWKHITLHTPKQRASSRVSFHFAPVKVKLKFICTTNRQRTPTSNVQNLLNYNISITYLIYIMHTQTQSKQYTFYAYIKHRRVCLQSKHSVHR